MRAHVSSSCSGSVPCKQKTNAQKITSLNDGTEITSHTHIHTPATPALLLLDLVVTSSYSPGPVCCKKKIVSCAASHPVFVYFSPPFPPPPLHRCCCICLQSQTAAAGQSDVPLKPEEFTVGDSTGEKLIVFPKVFNQLPLLVTSISGALPPLRHVVSSLLVSL